MIEYSKSFLKNIQAYSVKINLQQSDEEKQQNIEVDKTNFWFLKPNARGEHSNMDGDTDSDADSKCSLEDSSESESSDTDAEGEEFISWSVIQKSRRKKR